MRPLFAICAALLALAACKEELASVPDAVPMTDESLGFYCQMAMTEHDGPKAQVHLADTMAPLFFAQVRDAIAYQRMPEQAAEITAIYVSDMSHATSWQDPGADNWVAAAEAFYVVGSDAVGGMGAAEIVPFSVRADAEAFAVRHGGRVLGLSNIADAEVLAPVADGTKDPEETDYLNRIRSLETEGNG